MSDGVALAWLLEARDAPALPLLQPCWRPQPPPGACPPQISYPEVVLSPSIKVDTKGKAAFKAQNVAQCFKVPHILLNNLPTQTGPSVPHKSSQWQVMEENCCEDQDKKRCSWYL